MLQLNYIRENKDLVIERLSIKNFDGKDIVEKIIEIDKLRRESQNKLDDVLSEIKNISREVGILYKNGKQEEANSLKEKSKELNNKSKEYVESLNDYESKQNELLLLLPNLPHKSVNKGKSAEDNVTVYEEKINLTISPEALSHWEIAEKYGLIDFERGVKITGSGFPVYKGKGAKLQRALINYFLDKATENGFTEIEPPIMVNAETAYGTGQLPDKEGQMYYVSDDNFYLVPTAEVPVTNLYRNEILKSEELPIKLTAYTPCFRREAGSYGKDVRGLNRLHQFDKVEIVIIAQSEKSYEMLEYMKDYVSGILKELGLPFRILRLYGGDMSFTSALTYDMEVYSGGQKKWLEVSSVSNFESFQSNRLKLRFKDANGKTQLLHTLNGSALALPRIVAAILENNQTGKGITIPEVLHKYTGFKIID